MANCLTFGIGVDYEIKSFRRIISRSESGSALTRYGSAISTSFHASRSDRCGPPGELLPLPKNIHSASFAAVAGDTDCRALLSSSFLLDIRSNNPIPSDRRSVKLWALTRHYELSSARRLRSDETTTSKTNRRKIKLSLPDSPCADTHDYRIIQCFSIFSARQDTLSSDKNIHGIYKSTNIW